MKTKQVRSFLIDELSEEVVFSILESVYPGVYRHDIALFNLLKEGMQMRYNEVITEEEMKVSIYKTPKDLLKDYNIEFQKLITQKAELDNFRKKIIDDLQHKVEVRASDYPEWTKEMRTFIRQQVIAENFNSEDGIVLTDMDFLDQEGNYAFGKSFHVQFRYIEYDGGKVPFHCYATQNSLSPDVLFTYQEHQYNKELGCYDFEAKEQQEEKDKKSSTFAIVVCVIAVIMTAVAFLQSFIS